MKQAVAVFVLLWQAAYGQTQTTRPEFLVADVKQNKSGTADIDGGFLPGGQLGIRNAPLKTLLGFAYKGTDRLLDTYITGAPPWVGTDRFDITGKAPPNTSDKDLSLMLQVFLEHEFKLKVHEEPKTMSAFALVVAKGGPKLQEAKESGKTDMNLIGEQGPDHGGRHLGFTRMSMTDFAQTITEVAPGYVDRPIVDLTGLKGVYDFRLDFVGRGQVDNGGLTLFDAVGKLGLKLEERKIPVTVLVVDHVEKLSDDN